MYTTLISVAELQNLLKTSTAVMVFDCSFELMQPTQGDTQYAANHIAGAVRADLEQHLTAPKGALDAASGGRHPLPSRVMFAAWLGSVGFTSDRQAVVYDRQGGTYCGRLWWMLKWLGHDAVAVLDGGLQAWQASAGTIEIGPSKQVASPKLNEPNFPISPVGYELISTDTVLNQLGRPGQTIMDARGTPRFRGEIEPLDPHAGHIPGALNRPFTLNFDAQGFFKSAQHLHAEFTALLAGRDPATVVHHCGSGVTAVPNILAMEVAGLGKTALYAGSWSEWCSDPKRPMAQG